MNTETSMTPKNPETPESPVSPNTLNNEDYILRDYQKKAKKVSTAITKEKVRGNFTDIFNKNFESAQLIEMATWSWKTLVTWKIIEHIIKVKNRLWEKLNFGGLNILVLTNRIDGVNQFHDDWFVWRNGNRPVFSEKIRKNTDAKIFHSQWENLDTFNDWDFEETGTHRVFFLTHQTAQRKDFAEKIKNIDFIIVDEAHNVGFEDNWFHEVLKELSKKWRENYTPEILALTATPDNITKENFGESVFTFGLPEYLASEYSPSVHYQVVTGTSAEESEIQELEEKIQHAKKNTNSEIKKELIKNLEEDLETIFQKAPNLETLTYDILKNISENGEVKKSVIFVNSIEEADQMATIINSQNENIATAYHSKNPNKNTLSDFSDDNNPTKILIVVDKINESVDLPTVENVVFCRNTNNGKIFLQQFGRWLRGKNTVNYFDYVGNFKNFSWIGNIYKEYREYIKHNSSQNPYTENTEKFKVSYENIANLQSKNIAINLSDLIQQIWNLKERINLTEVDVINYFKDEGLPEEMREKTEDEIVEYWAGLTAQKRGKIKIKGSKLKAIGKMLRIKGNPNDNSQSWYELLWKIFWEKIIEKYILSKNDVINYFKDEGLSEKMKGKTEEEIVEYWIELKHTERTKIKIKGSGLRAIAKMFEVEGNPIGDNQPWYELLWKIFWEEIIENYILSKNNIINYFKDEGLPENERGKTEDEIVEYWIGLTVKERLKIKIKGNGLTAIAKLFEVDGNPIGNIQNWYELLWKIFNTTIKINELTGDDVINYFKDEWLSEEMKGKTEDEIVKHWVRLERREREKIKIKGSGFFAIASMFEVDGNPIGNIQIWYELLWKIFNTTIKINELTGDDVINYFKDEWLSEDMKGKTEEEIVEHWVRLTTQKRGKIKIKGNELKAIATLFRVTENPVGNNQSWYELLWKIFDQEIQ